MSNPSNELAVEVLDIAATIAEHNAPIHEAEGDAAQAALDRDVAEQCRNAAEKLRA